MVAIAQRRPATGPEVALRVSVVPCPGREPLVEEVLQREGFDLLGGGSPHAPAGHPDVAVVVGRGQDHGLALEACRELDGVPVVVVGEGGRRAVHDALDAGARGFVAHDEADERLAPTIRAVATGQVVIPAEFRQVVAPQLSAREKQVLSMVVLGFTNGDIANRLFVAESTVKSHLYSAYRKLGVRSRREATSCILDSEGGLGLGVLSLTEAQAPVS